MLKANIGIRYCQDRVARIKSGTGLALKAMAFRSSISAAQAASYTAQSSNQELDLDLSTST
jgi:hypothetical protein